MHHLCIWYQLRVWPPRSAAVPEPCSRHVEAAFKSDLHWLDRSAAFALRWLLLGSEANLASKDARGVPSACQHDYEIMTEVLVMQEFSGKPGVLLAFIVLDNPTASVLDMQSVSFVQGKPVLSKYIDSFPFPLYIVLRDIAALPSTLADLLRQWFELSNT